MTFEQIILILLAIAIWGFTIFSLFRGKNIEKEIPTSNKFASIVVFVIVAIVLVIKNHTTIGIICAIAIVIAGVLYACIPIGYNSEGLYMKNRRYFYNKIEYMEIEEQEKKALLHFKYKHEYHFIMVNKENIDVLKDLVKTYNRER